MLQQGKGEDKQKGWEETAKQNDPAVIKNKCFNYNQVAKKMNCLIQRKPKGHGTETSTPAISANVEVKVCMLGLHAACSISSFADRGSRGTYEC